MIFDSVSPRLMASAQMIELVQRNWADRDAGLRGFKSGLAYLDATTDQFDPGRLTAIVGPPRSGRTGLAMSIALAAACQGKRAIYVSTSMTPWLITHRAISSLSGLPSWKFGHPSGLNASEGATAARVGRMLMTLPFVPLGIPESKAWTVESVAAAVRCNSASRGRGDHHDYSLALIVVDGLQSLDMNTASGQGDAGQTAAALKWMSQAHNAHLIVCSNIDGKHDEALLHVDELHLQTQVNLVSEHPIQVVLKTVKNRNDKECDIVLDYDATCHRFGNPGDLTGDQVPDFVI